MNEDELKRWVRDADCFDPTYGGAMEQCDNGDYVRVELLAEARRDNEALRAENERLRKGLECIRDYPEGYSDRVRPDGYPAELVYDGYAYERMVDSYRECAAKALADTARKDEP